jgi:hypothetical protein
MPSPMFIGAVLFYFTILMPIGLSAMAQMGIDVLWI